MQIAEFRYIRSLVQFQHFKFSLLDRSNFGFVGDDLLRAQWSILTIFAFLKNHLITLLVFGKQLFDYHLIGLL